MIGYYDFSVCREAFATGQSDARPFELDGCYYRRRGRKHTHLTLLSFDDAGKAWDQLTDFRHSGAKVQSLNYTAPAGSVPTKPGPTEWVMRDFRAKLEETGSRGQDLRRATRRAGLPVRPTREQAREVFDAWAAWAASRHFMVFRGHYLSWLDLHFSGAANTHLVMFERSGIFGWEVQDGIAQVTLAKHQPEFRAKSLWSAGLYAISSETTLCGSTADTLKSQLGCEARASWKFDLTKITTES